MRQFCKLFELAQILLVRLARDPVTRHQDHCRGEQDRDDRQVDISKVAHDVRIESQGIGLLRKIDERQHLPGNEGSGARNGLGDELDAAKKRPSARLLVRSSLSSTTSVSIDENMMRTMMATVNANVRSAKRIGSNQADPLGGNSPRRRSPIGSVVITMNAMKRLIARRRLPRRLDSGVATLTPTTAASKAPAWKIEICAADSSQK